MTLHYLKIALRNMRRFKLQTIVCLTGLAVGMTCFALGTLWLRFIESFEDFVPDAEDVCLVAGGTGINRGGAEWMRKHGRELKPAFPMFGMGKTSTECCFRTSETTKRTRIRFSELRKRQNGYGMDFPNFGNNKTDTEWIFRTSERLRTDELELN